MGSIRRLYIQLIEAGLIFFHCHSVNIVLVQYKMQKVALAHGNSTTEQIRRTEDRGGDIL